MDKEQAKRRGADEKKTYKHIFNLLWKWCFHQETDVPKYYKFYSNSK